MAIRSHHRNVGLKRCGQIQWDSSRHWSRAQVGSYLIGALGAAYQLGWCRGSYFDLFKFRWLKIFKHSLHFLLTSFSLSMQGTSLQMSKLKRTPIDKRTTQPNWSENFFSARNRFLGSRATTATAHNYGCGLSSSTLRLLKSISSQLKACYLKACPLIIYTEI